MFKEPKPENHLTLKERILLGEIIPSIPLDQLFTQEDVDKETALDKLYWELWNEKLIPTVTLAARLRVHIDWETDGIELLKE